MAVLVALNQGNLPRADEISVNARVMAFSFGLSALVAVLLALVPLIRFSGRSLQVGLKESARGQSANASSHRLRALLVVSQMALTLVLLVGAGLLIKSS